MRTPGSYLAATKDAYKLERGDMLVKSPRGDSAAWGPRSREQVHQLSAPEERMAGRKNRAEAIAEVTLQG